MSSAEQALAVLMKHPEHAADPKVACRLLQVSTGCRAVVQQSRSGVCCLSTAAWKPSAYGYPDYERSDEQRVAGMLSWWLTHPGLVGSVDLRQQYRNLLLNPLLRGVLMAGTQPAALKLRSFSSCHMDVDVLRSLPAASLTSLAVKGIMPLPSVGPAVAQLTQLRNLTLHIGYGSKPHFPASIIGCLSTLTGLTQLSIGDISHSSDLRKLPLMLQRLELRYYHGSYFFEDIYPQVQLSQLTMLRKLRISSCKPALVSLPCQLLGLTVYAYKAPEYSVIDTYHIAELQQLQQLDMPLAPEDVRLSGLSGLRQLTHLGLHTIHVVPVCPVAFDLLSQLISLDVHLNVVNVDEFEQLMIHGVPTAKGLTALQLYAYGIDWEEWSAPSPWPLLAGLTSLCRLSMHFDGLDRMSELSGISKLSLLSRLTSLELLGWWDCVCSEIDLQVILLHMSQLQVLHAGCDSYQYYNTSVGTWGIGTLPVIGWLSQLRSLWYNVLSTEDAQRGLPLLTALSRLTELRGFDNAGDEALDSFWQAVRGVA